MIAIAPLFLSHDLNPNNSHNNLVLAMLGDDKSEPPPPPTMVGLAALMTKLLSSMGDVEARITSMESRLQPPPTSTPAASMPYGMPGYGSTTLASSSSTAAATLSAAPPTSSPTSSAPFYGMPGYGSTSLGSPSFTAAATIATAAFLSFTAPSPVPPQQHCEGIFYRGMNGI